MRRLVLVLLLLAAPVLAVQPDEILDDPVLEERAREISSGLRCLVCRNENIDASNADLARDMRLLVRERLLEGDSNEAAVAFIVDRYGEYVLLQPRATGANLVLYLAGPAMLLLALIMAGLYLRRRAQAPEPAQAPLSAEEERRLRDIMRQ